MTTITAERRALLRKYCKTGKVPAALGFAELQEELITALDALEEEESRRKGLDTMLEASTEETRACFSAAYVAADKIIPELQQKLDHAETALSQAKRELERVEREKNIIATQLASLAACDFCAFWDSCQGDGVADCKDGVSQWAAAEAAKGEGEKESI